MTDDDRTGGLSLDAYVDTALADNRRDASWESLAEAISGTEALTFGGPVGARLPQAGNPFARLFSTEIGHRALLRFGSESRGLAAVGDLAVQPLLHPERLDEVIGRVLGRPLGANPRRLIVYHGDGGVRRSVLVLDPDLPSDAPASVIPGDLLLDFLGRPSERAEAALKRLDLGDNPELVTQAISVARPRVVVGPAPPMVKTCVPVPPWKVEHGAEVSTVGALVRDAQGRRGVTVCHHGTGAVGAAVVLVDGARRTSGTVSLASQTLDIGFVPVGDDWQAGSLSAVRGVLTSRAPGRAEKHSFRGYGMQGGTLLKTTEILATDWGVPGGERGRQLCVQTRADTNHGDSGAALINEDDFLVGFAFQRTPYGSTATVTFADWIWARSALDELDLTPTQ